MDEIESESKFIWKFIFHIFLTPIIFLMIIFNKKEWGDLLLPFKELWEFIFEPKFTIWIIIITILTSFYSWFFLSIETFDLLLNYPQDLLFYDRWFSLFSSAFIHGSFGHLFGNMFALFIFGRVVERKFGLNKTACIYFGAMFISSLGDSAINLLFNSTGGSLGASGALMGLVAAAMLIEPFYFTYELIIPLPIMFDAWLAIFFDLIGVLNPEGDGVAHFAHIFGYLSIVLLLYFFNNEEKEIMKKGFYINLISIFVIGLGYFLII